MTTRCACVFMVLMFAVVGAYGQELPPPQKLPEGNPSPQLEAAVIMPETEPVEVLPDGMFANPATDTGYIIPTYRGRLSYLHWWTRDDRYPVFLTVGSSGDAMPGVIGQTNTRALDSDTEDEEGRSGFRLNIGYTLDSVEPQAWEFDFFFLGQRRTEFPYRLDSDQVLARVYIDADTLAESAFIVSQTDVANGFVDAFARTDFWGMEWNNRYLTTYNSPPRFVQFLIGIRYLQLDDFLRITEVSTDAAPLGDATRDDFIARYDEFSSNNHFFGPQIGAEAEWNHNRMYCSVFLKVALGVTFQNISIRGKTTTVNNGIITGPLPIGFLARETNIGNYDDVKFGVIPELGFHLGYEVSNHCRLTVGYNYLYWSAVGRASAQVDRQIHGDTLAQPAVVNNVTPARPRFRFHQDDYWAQGLTFSLELRY